ncbi:hypothetical protein GPUN_0878 [Glaciecola punicea ACAM 611]|uniref:Uncharacterized protein n=1 Tax=Glaciecola punicea ACAM 611 TaxID=1121923 RepID=H5T9N3_9ALTE|nr:hypothetical protein GPUN_0878 [Glaciecola punicea ACAM 611]
MFLIHAGSFLDYDLNKNPQLEHLYVGLRKSNKRPIGNKIITKNQIAHPLSPFEILEHFGQDNCAIN